MARHYNPSITEDLTRILNTKAGDNLSDDVQGIVATIGIRPVCRIVKRGTVSNATSATIFTTPAEKDFYLIAASISMIKDVTATSVASRINITIDGVAVNILEIAGITLTVQNDSMSLSFPEPIRVDRNTNITILNSAATANVTATGTIYGYTVEVSRP